MKFASMVVTIAAGFLVLGGGTTAKAACARDDSHCRSLVGKAKKIRARDPEAEAKAEIAGGNFKLGRTFRYGDPIVFASSHMPGVDCITWPRTLVSKEISGDDVIMPGEDEHAKAAEWFLAIYNRTKVAAPQFPYRDICAVTGNKRARFYDGPVTTVAQAARSGKIEAIVAVNPSLDALNAEDEFAITPLGWAMFHSDLAMGLALIERGADPNRLGWVDAPTPIGQAILAGDYASARDLRKKGGRLYEGTNLCPKKEMGMFDVPAEIGPESKLPDAVPPVSNCSWAGLLLQKGQLDLLIYLLETAPPFVQPTGDENFVPNEVLDSEGDIYNAFKLAIRDSDMALASRLEPWIGDGGDYTTDIVEWLYRYHAYPLLFSRLARDDEAAHSPVEAVLWKTAASHNQPKALAMIWDYGHALNYLTPAQVKACDSAVVAGDEAGIADLCIRTSFSRAEAVYGAIKAKDTPRVKSLLAETSSLTEDYKPQLESYIAKFGLSEMLELLPPRPQKAEYFTGHLFLSATVNGQRSLNNRRMYDGPLKKELDAWVLPYISCPADASWPFSPVGSAVLNNDPVMARGLAKRGYKWLSREVQSLPPISMGLEDAVPGASLRMYDGIEDSERYPSRPADESLWQRLNLFLPVIAEAEGPEGLRDIFEASARYGWNDVIDLTVAAGFDAKTTKGPVEIWRNWAGSGFFGLCKPSTGRKLLHLGLPLGPVGEDNWTVLRVAAAVCRDPQALRFLVTEAGVDVNELGGTMTALDEAMPRYRPEIVAVLKSLGAKSGKELVPEKIAETRQKVIAEGADPDFWQWD